MIDTVLWVAAISFLVAGTVKGTLGIGLPTTAVSLLAQVTDARTAIALLIPCMVITNLWQMYRSGNIRAVCRAYWPLVVSLILVLAVVSQLAVAIPIGTITLLLGVVIVLFAIVNLTAEMPLLPDRFDPVAQVVAGALAGLMGGIAGIWAPPIIAYLSARRIDKQRFVRIVGVMLFVGSSVLAMGYWKAGILTPPLALEGLLLVVPTMLGFTLGEKLRHRLSSESFRKAVLWFFLVMGLNLIRKGWLT